MTTRPSSIPHLRRRRRNLRGKAREGVKRDNRSGPLPPAFAKKPLPDADAYPHHSDGEPRWDLCSAKDYEGYHEIDYRFAGWAKGHGDGRFDVSCKGCGEVGTVIVKVREDTVAWG